MKTCIHLITMLIVVSLAAVGMSFAQQGDQVGKVKFPNSCSPATQKAFQEVAAEDNSCAIAAWGYASILMLNPLGGTGASPKNAEQAQDAIDKGRKMGAKTERERDYLEAVAAYYE